MLGKQTQAINQVQALMSRESNQGLIDFLKHKYYQGVTSISELFRLTSKGELSGAGVDKTTASRFLQDLEKYAADQDLS